MDALFLKTNQQIRELLGTRIKKYRIESGYSQTDVSKKTGVSVHSISNIESGKDFNFDSLIRILKFLNLVDNISLLVPETVPNPYDIIKGIDERKRSKRK